MVIQPNQRVPRAFRRLSLSPTVGGFSIEFNIEPRRSAILEWENRASLLLLTAAACAQAQNVNFFFAV